jgi:hypothetical protein
MKQKSQINWSELTEQQKEEIGKTLARAYVHYLKDVCHKEALKLVTPNWMVKLKQSLCFHDWKCLDYSGYSSIAECRICEKIKTFKHKKIRK